MFEYVKECMYCHEAKIRMSDKDGKWKAYNLDGSVHDCKSKAENKTEKVKVATIDGLAALDLIPHLGKGLRFVESEIRGSKIVEVFLQ
ncbi:MAG TPA: hypothetical protein VJ772_06490 [Nitrososphaeraceae archaeon]|nr:hypothetical protein [Nitrososphaeraceae archaeon]